MRIFSFLRLKFHILYFQYGSIIWWKWKYNYCTMRSNELNILKYSTWSSAALTPDWIWALQFCDLWNNNDLLWKPNPVTAILWNPFDSAFFSSVPSSSRDGPVVTTVDFALRGSGFKSLLPEQLCREFPTPLSVLYLRVVGNSKCDVLLVRQRRSPGDFFFFFFLTFETNL